MPASFQADSLTEVKIQILRDKGKNLAKDEVRKVMFHCQNLFAIFPLSVLSLVRNLSSRDRIVFLNPLSRF